MRALMIGDACIDHYPRLGRSYPTGNVVDTGVHLRRLGWEVLLVSAVGDDAWGVQLRQAMIREGLDVARLHTLPGKTAVTEMDLVGRERVHGEYREGVLAELSFSPEDIQAAAGCALVHTAFWGKAEGVLAGLKAGGALLSFDFATGWDSTLASQVIPQVDVGFFSLEADGPETRAFIQSCVRRGMALAVATFGDKGSLAWDGRKWYRQEAYPAQIVNTVGAGDSFIAGFLNGCLRQLGVQASLALGAQLAAQVVSVFEPWDYRQKEETAK
ncbi:fructoselysine 6-kinase [Flavonifractor sp. HCP28S3_F3]|uniref:fructoselysine 6-kinase n=1 Tax=Flavonifractor sp. HCP28S3_F3 TaxID=3438939 RepID=UPI003F8AF831